jgi:8-oxo-dGTP pyrophosphatase MutT (NUDIX family)
MSWATYAGAGGIVVDGSRLLWVRQRRHYGMFWELPSGFVEAGESFERAAVREVLEETGIAIDLEQFVCTLVWEREHDRRRNVLAFFLAKPVDRTVEPRGQLDEEIDDAAYVDPDDLGDEIHPLNQVILDRWWKSRETGFHIHADVTVNADGTQSYVFS